MPVAAGNESSGGEANSVTPTNKKLAEMRAFFGIGVRMRISEKAVRPQTKGRREYAGEAKNRARKQRFLTFTFVVILTATPCWLWSVRIHNAIASALSNASPLAAKSWILQTASAYRAA